MRFCNIGSRLEAPMVVVEVTVEGGLIGGSTVRVVILVMVFWGGVKVMILVVGLWVVGLSVSVLWGVSVLALGVSVLALGVSLLAMGVSVLALRVLVTVLVS